MTRILAVLASPTDNSLTSNIFHACVDAMRAQGANVDVLNLYERADSIPFYHPPLAGQPSDSGLSSIPFYNEKNNTSGAYKAIRPFIYDTKTGTVITVQNNAWMDMIGILMWLDTVIKPYNENSTFKKSVIIWDNLSSHVNSYVVSEFKKAGITAFTLPPKMTMILQVIDLVINGPLKADQRRQRAFKIVDSVEQYGAKAYEAEQNQKTLDERFEPPSLSLGEGITVFMNSIFEKFNKNDAFKKSVAECFVKVGIFPDSEGTWSYYSREARGFNTMAPPLALADPDRIINQKDNRIRCNEVMELVHVYSRNRFNALQCQDQNFTRSVLGVDHEECDNVIANEDEVIGVKVPNPVQEAVTTSIPGNNVVEPLLELYDNAESLKHIKKKKELIQMLEKRNYHSTKLINASLADLKTHLVDWSTTEKDRRAKSNSNDVPVPTVLSIDVTTTGNNIIPAALTTDDNAALNVISAETAPTADAVLRNGAKKRKVNQSTTTTSTASGNAPEKYCHCDKTISETMLECSNKDKCDLFRITKGWYHVSCVGVKNIKGIKNTNWLCPVCASRGNKK